MEKFELKGKWKAILDVCNDMGLEYNESSRFLVKNNRKDSLTNHDLYVIAAKASSVFRATVSLRSVRRVISSNYIKSFTESCSK